MQAATPYLAIRTDVIRRNIQAVATYARQHNLKVRPHTKTHKSLLLAKMQLAAGAQGLTTAKVGEAEIMASVCDDILIAYPTVDPARTQRAAVLAQSITLRVAVDSVYAADALSQAAVANGTTIGILVDLDVGMHRTGTQSPVDALKLAQNVARCPNLRLDGLFCYPGHISGDPDQQGDALQLVSNLLRETLDLWKRSGLHAEIVSGGSTPSAFQSHRVPELTEIRPGTYLFNDMNTTRGQCCELDSCAANVVCTVISDAVPGKVVVDAGSKTLTSDRNGRDPESGFGHVMEYPEAKVVRLTEEHGEVDVSRCKRKPSIGERVRIIPNHICPCVNLQDVVWLEDEAGNLERVPVDARGRLS